MVITYKLLLIVLCLVLVSCGKEVEQTPQSKPRSDRSRDGAVVIGDYLKSQQLECEPNVDCPGYIAKIIVSDNGKRTQCTGVLIQDNKILTSASCIPRRLRIPSLKCSDRIFAIFPKTKFNSVEISACNRIDEVSNNLFSEQSLWKSDLLIFSLVDPPKRRSANTSILGMKDTEHLVSWHVKKKSDFLGIIEKQECEVIHQSYLNPFADHKFSPMQVVSNCHFAGISTGAALMRNNIVAGVYSSEMSESLYNYLKTSGLMSEELQSYYHVSNTVCSRFLNSRVFNGDEITPKECNPIINHGRRDRLRINLLKTESIHTTNMSQVEQEIELPQKYFKWDVKFFADRASKHFQALLTRPKCISNTNEWIGEYRGRFSSIKTYARVEFSTPSYELKTKLNDRLRPVSVIDTTDTKNYIVEFNPFDAHVNNTTSVTITSTLFGKETRKIYNDVTNNCLY